MGFRVKRYGPFSTIVVVGRFVGMFEPALVIVTIAATPSASATNKNDCAKPTHRQVVRQERDRYEPVESKPGNDRKPPCNRRMNYDLSGICCVMHGGTMKPSSLGMSQAKCIAAGRGFGPGSSW